MHTKSNPRTLWFALCWVCVPKPTQKLSHACTLSHACSLLVLLRLFRFKINLLESAPAGKTFSKNRVKRWHNEGSHPQPRSSETQREPVPYLIHQGCPEGKMLTRQGLCLCVWKWLPFLYRMPLGTCEPSWLLGLHILKLIMSQWAGKSNIKQP